MQARTAILRDRFWGRPAGMRVSKQDDHFFNVFSAVLGILLAITIGLFMFARILGGGMTEAHIDADPLLQRDVAARIKPFGRVAVAGQDNSALAIEPPPGAAGEPAAAAALPSNGEETYNAVCSACHSAGIGGAPKIGDKNAWAPRLAKGMDLLHQHSLQGFQGQAGYMPAKGGRPDLPDELVVQATDYMLDQAR